MPGATSPVGRQRVAVALSSLGLMADVYDMSVINIVRPALEAEYGKLTPGQDAMLTGAVLLGAVFGQIVFGVLADVFGRRRICIVTAAVMAVASLASALAQPGILGLDIYVYLTICRFILGLGMGGEYPLAAANTVENVDRGSSGSALAVTVGGMALAGLGGPVLACVLAVGLHLRTRLIWRLALGFAALMAVVLAALRFVLVEETNSFRRTKAGGIGTAIGVHTDPSCSRQESTVSALLAMRWSLAGTAGAYYLYFIASYGGGMFCTSFFRTRPGLETAGTLLVIGLLQLPAALGGVVAAANVSMRSMQMLGLSAMTLCFALLAQLHGVGDANGGIVRVLGLLTFSLQQAFDTMGPGVTMFAVPAQIFPTKIRGTAHGISSAFGKLGALVGTTMLPFLIASGGNQAGMTFMAITSAIATLWTYVFTPYYGAQELEAAFKAEASGAPLNAQASMAERILYVPSLDPSAVLTPLKR